MNNNNPMIKKPEDFIDPRAREVLKKYNLSVEKLDYYFSRHLNRGKNSVVSINDVIKDSSIIKEFASIATLAFELTKRSALKVPIDSEIPAEITFTVFGETKRCYFYSCKIPRELPVSEYEKYAKVGLETAEYLQKSLNMFIEIKEMVSNVSEIMRFGKPNVVVDPSSPNNLIMERERSPDGRSFLNIFLKDLYEPKKVAEAVATTLGHQRFRKDHPNIHKFLDYLNRPFRNILQKYNLSKPLLVYFPYLLHEYAGRREVRKRGIDTGYFTFLQY